MRESRVWTYIEGHKPTWLEIERFEFQYPPGGSDCFYVDRRNSAPIAGWLELKYNANGITRDCKIPKLKPEQPIFLGRQARHDLPSGILLRSDVSWMLWVARADRQWSTDVKAGLHPDRVWEYLDFDLGSLFTELFLRHNEVNRA
jgi:hypothetical protein